MRMSNAPIATEGIPFLLPAAAVSLACILFSWTLPAALALAVTAFIAFFFRNPERTPPPGEEQVVAPADGTVVFVGEARAEHLDEPMLKISIFMSVFNVHVNRAPVSGEVLDAFRVAGKFLDVRDERATFENEREGLVLATPAGQRLLVVQVAGLIARRIVCYAKPGDRLQRGERYGLIRFGSRLDIYLPVGTQPAVALGERTRAGETVLGRLS